MLSPKQSNSFYKAHWTAKIVLYRPRRLFIQKNSFPNSSPLTIFKLSLSPPQILN